MNDRQQMKIRVPSDAKAFIEARARENASTQNSEIVRCIRAAMKKVGAAEAATSPRLGHGVSLAGENQ